jgi:tetratricopeptide (TPR) repeat protein
METKAKMVQRPDATPRVPLGGVWSSRFSVFKTPDSLKAELQTGFLKQAVKFRLGLSLLCLIGMAAAATTNSPLPSSVAYTGSSSCRECHARFYQLWAPSHHGLAMQPYSLARTNLSEQKADISVGAYRYRADVSQGVVVSRGPDGERRYRIEQAMGGKNVLYFLTPLERGRLQVLPVAYDLRRQQWFDTAGSAVRHFPTHPDEPIHWMESPYTFNTACFNCHVSQLTNNYNLKTDTYDTHWAEPGINCETCHGPAAEHVRVARETPQGQPLKDLKLVSLKTFTPEQANSICGSCHAKVILLTNSFPPGDRFFDHFGLVTLESIDFYPDGRDLGENFTYTTWRLSPCLKSDKLNCVTCHTSSGRYRFLGEAANNACLPCHRDNVRNVAAHSHHQAGTDGANCVSCHMPMTEFARMRRSDHSMRPPMPAATIAYGSPNACNLCHTNKDAAWADQQVRQWHKRDYQAPVLLRASWIAAARKGDWSKLPAIVSYLADSNREEIWSSALLQLLRACSDETKWKGIVPCLEDRSPLVRAAAVEALGDHLRMETIEPLLAATRDDFRLVRIRAAAALAGVPREAVPEKARAAWDAATDELLSSFLARPDDAASHHNLGNFHLERHEYPQAITAFQTAVKLQPQVVASLVNVSIAYNLAGQNDQAEASLRRAFQLEPTNAAVNLNLGMLLAEMDKLPEAGKAFRAAFKADPRSAQAAFNLGVLLAKEHPDEALTLCRRAAELSPQEPKYAYTLAFYQYQQGQTNAAVQTLEKLVQRAPAHAESYALLGQIYESQANLAKARSAYQRGADNDKLPESQRARFLARLQALPRIDVSPRRGAPPHRSMRKVESYSATPGSKRARTRCQAVATPTSRAQARP